MNGLLSVALTILNSILVTSLYCQNHIRSLQLSATAPTATHDNNKTFSYSTFTTVQYAMGNLLVYEHPVTVAYYDSSTNTQRLTHAYTYFLYKMGEDSGFDSTQPDSLFNRKIPVISYLQSSALDPKDLTPAEFFKIAQTTKLEKSIYNGDSLEEVYDIVPRQDTSHLLKLALSYKIEFDDSGFCLSDSLNKAKKMHLYAWRIIFDKGLYKGTSSSSFYVEKKIDKITLSAEREAKIRKLFDMYYALSEKKYWIKN